MRAKLALVRPFLVTFTLLHLAHISYSIVQDHVQQPWSELHQCVLCFR